MAKFNPDAEDLAEAALRWIARLNSGMATTADRQAWQDWRATSARHEQAAVEAESLWADLSQLHVDQDTGLIKPGRKQRGLSRRAMLTGLGAIAVTGVASTGAWRSGAFTRLFADHVTAVATTSVINLPDGSRATLGAYSAIDVLHDRVFRGIQLLQGQVFLEVAGDLPAPFEIRTDNASVLSSSAVLDVTRDLPDGAAEVAVVTETVQVITQNAPPLDLRAGEIVTLNGMGHAGPVRHQNVADIGAWRQGSYRANARTLDEVVAALSPWYGGSIVIAGNDLRSLRVDAVLDLRDPRGSLDALQGGLPIRVRHLADLLTVISSV